MFIEPRNGLAIDLAAGWYYYVDTTNSSQTDPWGHMIANSGAPQSGGVIQVPCGGISAGRASCDTWGLFNNSVGGTAFAEFAATCLPTLFTYTITSSYVLNPDPVNFTFEYINGVYPA
jgi:hypothetical protein